MSNPTETLRAILEAIPHPGGLEALEHLRKELNDHKAAAEGWFRSWETADRDRCEFKARIADLEGKLRAYSKAIAETHGAVSLRSGLAWEYTASPVDVGGILRMADLEHERKLAETQAHAAQIREALVDLEAIAAEEHPSTSEVLAARGKARAALSAPPRWEPGRHQAGHAGGGVSSSWVVSDVVRIGGQVLGRESDRSHPRPIRPGGEAVSTSVSIKTQYATTTVEVPTDDLNFQDFFELVLEPALVAVYSQAVVDNYLGDK